MKEFLENRDVLLVDDEDQIRLFMRRMLTRLCPLVEIREAGDGLAAIEQLRIAVPDVVVLDLDMPRMGGRDVLKHMRETPGLEHVPVLVLTGGAPPGSEVELISIGATDFTNKPVDRSVLLARLSSMLRVQAHVRSLEERIRKLEETAQ